MYLFKWGDYRLLGLLFWSHLGDRFNTRGTLAAVGYIAVAALMHVAFTATGLVNKLGAMILAVFCISAYTACEYAFVQRLIPGADVAAGTGLYNGITIVAGGSLAPLVASGILEPEGDYSLWLLIGLALSTGVMLYSLGRLRQY